MVEALKPPAGWVEKAGGIGIGFETGEVEALGRYLAMLLDENTRMNLTAVRDAEEAWDRHILDALTLVPVLAEVSAEGDRPVRVMDVGSGGGIPGIPLAIVMPAVEFTLLDATAKKCAFLQRVVDEMGLPNVSVVCARAEKLGHDRGEKTGTGRVGAYRDGFDVVVARAVGRMALLLELTVPMARVGGLVVMTKGQKADEELAEAKGALHLLHAAHAGTVDTPTGRIVVVEKLRTTPRDYPRADGEPKRSPLGMARDR